MPRLEGEDGSSADRLLSAQASRKKSSGPNRARVSCFNYCFRTIFTYFFISKMTPKGIFSYFSQVGSLSALGSHAAGHLQHLRLSYPALTSSSQDLRHVKPSGSRSSLLETASKLDENLSPSSPLVRKDSASQPPCPCSHEKISEKRKRSYSTCGREKRRPKCAPEKRRQKVAENGKTEEWAYLQLQLGLARSISPGSTHNNNR